MVNRHEILEPDCTYHIYNHAHGNEKMFRSAENYRFFMEKYRLYVSPVVDTFCYCLMPNHFHFLVRCKSEEALVQYYRGRGRGASKSLTGILESTASLSGIADAHTSSSGIDLLRRQQELSKLLTLQFSHLFNCYTQAFNKQHGRMGGLFMRPFNRIAIRDMHYLQTVVRYIHRNPADAGFCKGPEHWPYSSFHAIVENDHSFLKAEEVIDWFEDKENFLTTHNYSVDIRDSSGHFQ